MNTQQQRLAWRSGFFALFILAPILDIFRFNLIQHHFVLPWNPWTLGIQESKTAAEISINILLRFFLPLVLVVGSGIYISWKWGRLYCGWLCPHFSVVEIINALMRRASGKLSIKGPAKLRTRQGVNNESAAYQGRDGLTPNTLLFH